MNSAEFLQLQTRQGLHAFVLVLSNAETRRAIGQDFWLRLLIVMMSSFAVIGGGFAWFNRDRSARLQIRLLRAQEMNLHLRDMNIAAAGLAHETRNPLNIVRGLAQMIAKNDNLAAQEKESANNIAVEVDRVTTRLNEFINYSRPIEPKWGTVRLFTIVDEVNRALTSDREDHHIGFEVEGSDLAVRADEALLRQVLFNLILNAIQALEDGGAIRVRIAQSQLSEATLEVLDDGPGVADEIQEDIFRPYFTGHEKGTGLGLAVVRQIVLAHHWDIEYLHNTPKGAIFRITGMQIVKNA
jgi:signal transduction histidine kinase